MQCDRTRLNLLAYVDGELSVDQAAEIDCHLLACAACTAELARLRRQTDALRVGLRVSAPDDLTRRIRARLSRMATKDRVARAPAGGGGVRSWLRKAALTAATVALAISGLSLFSPPAYAAVVSNAAYVGDRLSDLAAQHIAVWPALMEAMSALGALLGL